MGLTGELLDLVLPRRCAGCGIDLAAVPLCPGCLAPLLLPAAPVRPVPAPPGLPPGWAVAPYEGPVRRMIVVHKDRGRTALAHPLGRALATSILAAAQGARVAGPEEVLWLVPVPSARRAVRRRGHDPTARIVAVAVAQLRAQGIRAARLDILGHRRPVADQAGLSAAQRVANLAQALAVTGSAPRPRSALLVDDVITTGATLAEAARALRAAAIEVPSTATIATTPRHT